MQASPQKGDDIFTGEIRRGQATGWLVSQISGSEVMFTFKTLQIKHSTFYELIFLKTNPTSKGLNKITSKSYQHLLAIIWITVKDVLQFIMCHANDTFLMCEIHQSSESNIVWAVLLSPLQQRGKFRHRDVKLFTQVETTPK